MDQGGNGSKPGHAPASTTRDGNGEIHIVSNLHDRISAIRIAGLYRGRWQIETAFQEVAENLESEIKTLGYPKAALFGFAMGMVTYNLLSVVRATVRAVHGEAAAEKLSTYYVSNEVAAVHFGMSVVLDDPFWRKKYAHLTPKQMADELKTLARNMRLSKYMKNKWTPKKPPTKKMSKRRRNHISIARVLQESRS